MDEGSDFEESGLIYQVRVDAQAARTCVSIRWDRDTLGRRSDEIHSEWCVTKRGCHTLGVSKRGVKTRRGVRPQRRLRPGVSQTEGNDTAGVNRAGYGGCRRRLALAGCVTNRGGKRHGRESPAENRDPQSDFFLPRPPALPAFRAISLRCSGVRCTWLQ